MSTNKKAPPLKPRAQTAGAMKPASKPKLRGEAESTLAAATRKAKANGTTAAGVFASKTALNPSQPLAPADEAFLTEYLRNNQNGTAAWRAVYPEASPATAATMAGRLLRKVEFSARLASERKRIAKAHEASRDELLGVAMAIVRADPNELMQVRHVACPACWAADTAPGDLMPLWMDVDPDCVVCQGEGETRAWFADTRKLSPEAHALFAGISITKDGMKVHTHDKLAALQQAGRMIGAYDRDNAQAGQSAADALREMFAGLHSAHRKPGPSVMGMTIVPADQAEPQGGKDRR